LNNKRLVFSGHNLSGHAFRASEARHGIQEDQFFCGGINFYKKMGSPRFSFKKFVVMIFRSSIHRQLNGYRRFAISLAEGRKING